MLFTLILSQCFWLARSEAWRGKGIFSAQMMNCKIDICRVFSFDKRFRSLGIIAVTKLPLQIWRSTKQSIQTTNNLKL